jgi:hypothetical protein
LKNLRDLGVDVVTAPNFSLFTDVPRWDNLHNIKRIAIAWADIQAAGIATALHVNARTETDWMRWAEFIRTRDEISCLAFEFGTGAGWPGRTDWHTERLCELARAVGRPLSLVLRGGVRQVPRLAEAFPSIVFIDTDSYLRTMKRRRAAINAHSRLSWLPEPTGPGEPLDDLLSINVRARSAWISNLLNASSRVSRQAEANPERKYRDGL